MRNAGRKIEKKGRYDARLSREEGTIIKDWGGRLAVALIYPNTYYLGMSNLGVHAVYSLLNSQLRVVCERVFLDTTEKNAPAALESGRPLTDFAVLAFSLSYELDYFNAVNMLKAAGIPLFASDRNESHPLIIAGGPCATANPMPLAPLFDCFCIGDAEAILPAMLPVLSAGVGGPRADLLTTLAALPGVYVPLIPPVKPVARQWAKNLDDFPVKTAILTQDTELGDSFLIEVERGCGRGCRFCLVGSTYSPVRFHHLDRILAEAKIGLNSRRRIGLVGPAVTDHPQIMDIFYGLNKLRSEISISSLRLDTLTPQVIDELARGKVQTITIAPEAGSERLRTVINKGLTEDNILRVADRLAGQHFTQVKLYFIIGLPTETEEDINEIVRLATAFKERLEKRPGGMRIIVNASPFVPKAATPFQWLPMASPETLDRRMGMLRSSLPLKGIKFNEESPAWSLVQGVLSRGDERVAHVLADMSEISLPAWRKTVEQHQLNVYHYTNTKWETYQQLPWSVIDSGMNNERLCGELEKAVGK
jgi:radical SAM superfamily enzyme YgiQ (UPF0313 family)